MAEAKLERTLGLGGAVTLNLLDMIGVGPFITLPLLLAAMGGPQAMLGWVLGALVWCVMTWNLWRAREVWRRVVPAFAIFTVLVVSGPLLWLWYNQHFFHDPLDFLRGPYSAPAIEKKTSPPGSKHYRGWHNPGWALLFYTRTAQVDAAVWETGWAVMVAALVGLWVSVRPDGDRTFASANDTHLSNDKAVAKMGHPYCATAWLLWLPLPFYVYSVAYGSVPIFIPQLWPHSYYNARYGMELLPALCIYATLAASRGDAWLAGLPAHAEIL